jgi:hypothetical protein
VRARGNRKRRTLRIAILTILTYLEAASPASKLENAENPSAWKVSGDLLEPVTNGFKREVPAAVVALGNIARIKIKARNGGT